MEIKEISQLLPDCYFNHVRREGNQVAHVLAQLAMRRKQCKVKRFSIPKDISKIVEKDVNDGVMTAPNCNFSS
jgi:hypothetical protein